MRVGMPRTPYLEGVMGFSSMLSFAISTLSPSAADISSRAGAIILQGPHHSAQKSTTTGRSALRTSLSKLASVTLEVLIFSPYASHAAPVTGPAKRRVLGRAPGASRRARRAGSCPAPGTSNFCSRSAIACDIKFYLGTGPTPASRWEPVQSDRVAGGGNARIRKNGGFEEAA